MPNVNRQSAAQAVTDPNASTNADPSHNWRPGQPFRERKSVDHTMRHGIRSMIRSTARRPDFDVADLETLAMLTVEIDAALVVAARQLHTREYSWAAIARPLGITRQTAHERFG